MEITFEPYPDRSGAATHLTRCESSLSSLDTSALSGTIHIAKRDGKFVGFSRDLRQELLFTEDAIFPKTDGKTEAAGG
jgi:hypothetical protein